MRINLLFLLFTLLSYEQGFPQKYIREIKDVMEKQKLAWNVGDIPKFMEGYAHQKNLKFVSANGTFTGYDALLSRYQKAYPTSEKMGVLDFEIISVEKLGRRHAYMSGKWKLKREAPIEGYFSLILRKKRRQWRIIADHTS